MSRPFNPLTKQILAYHRSRCQARYRHEEWDPAFTFETWWSIWEASWPQRGTFGHCLIMVRSNPDRAWSQHNVELMNRREWLSQCGRCATGETPKRGGTFRGYAPISR